MYLDKMTGALEAVLFAPDETHAVCLAADAVLTNSIIIHA